MLQNSMHGNELNQQVQSEQQHARAIQEYAEIVVRDAEVQMQQSWSYWTVSGEEIKFTETELGSGTYGTIKVATFRRSQVATKCYHQILSNHNLATVFSVMRSPWPVIFSTLI